MPVSPNPSGSKSKSRPGAATRPRRPYFELRVGDFEMSLERR